MMIELNEQETSYLVRLLKASIQTDVVVKLVEKLERRAEVQEAAEKGAAS